MPRLTLQLDSKNAHTWVILEGQRLIPLRDGDGILTLPEAGLTFNSFETHPIHIDNHCNQRYNLDSLDRKGV